MIMLGDVVVHVKCRDLVDDMDLFARSLPVDYIVIAAIDCLLF